MPNLFILAGPNGAGKSTSAPRVLSGARRVDEFVNADVIAKEEGVSEIEAGRRTLERLGQLAQARRDMAFETTLASRTLLPRIQAMQAAGYQCDLTFCWLPNANMAVMRVAKRVAAGGHSIPEDVIRRRYERGLENLFSHYLGIVDSWRIVDNTAPPPGRLIAWRDSGAGLQIADAGIWTKLVISYMKPRAEEPVALDSTAEKPSWTSHDIMDAINVAVTEALRRHKARGESIVVWRDGKIVTLTADEIDV
ncbi:MAG TPA: AAA family ATPase [Burkholderiales bacterium]|nr:AAA family ATPase [Burkholderiales bacterium]